MKIVLDRNVLVTALLNPKGIPAQIMSLIIEKKVTLLLDSRIYAEYSEVLRRPKFQFKDEWINPVLDFIRMESEWTMAEPLKIEFPDSDDKMFWEVAKSGNALYIVTGNRKHFPEDPLVISPAEFMEKYLG